ncbi:TetR/AcrR family transcriptional regulator [Reyranella massiliensis]|uniref:TetR/AcrR family transcriptional regulator n=1 Tax=Reyranella massiliensis TaxID=445220 RepID=UPI0005C29215|nr:TetR/AcrR family transcriptional regulator [Reyranella massiliensis]
MTERSEGKPSRRGRPRSTAAEAAILDAAYGLIVSKGLTAATMDAIARASKVSKMTVYKWWPSREALLIDAFLRHASLMLPLTEEGDPISTLQRHAAAYAEALKSEFGKVQLAVISECIAKTGSAQLFTERYLDIRRRTATAIIERGQREGSIMAGVAAGDLYDRIYGTLFYRFLFQFRPLSGDYARKLVASLLMPQ